MKTNLRIIKMSDDNGDTESSTELSTEPEDLKPKKPTNPIVTGKHIGIT